MDQQADIIRVESATRTDLQNTIKTKQWGLANDSNPSIGVKTSTGEMIHFPAEMTDAKFKNVTVDGIKTGFTQNIGCDANGKLIIYTGGGGAFQGAAGILNVSDGSGGGQETTHSQGTGEFIFSEPVKVGAPTDPAHAVRSQDLADLYQTVESQTSGVFSGGVIQYLSGTQLTITAGTGVVIDSYTDPRDPEITPLTWGTTTFTPTDIVPTGIMTYTLYRDKNNVLKNKVGFLNEEERRNIFHGYFGTRDGVIQTGNIVSAPFRTNNTGNLLMSYINFKKLNEQVRGIGCNAVTAALSIWTNAAQQFIPYTQFGTPQDPSIVPIPQKGNTTTPATFGDYLRNGVKLSDLTVIPKFWDNAGVRTALGGTKATIHYLYESPQGELFLQEGQTAYNNYDSAISALSSDKAKFIANPVFSQSMIFVAQIVVSEPATSFAANALILNAYGDSAPGGYSDEMARAAVISQTVTDGTTDRSPSENAVFDAINSKTVQSLISPLSSTATLNRLVYNNGVLATDRQKIFGVSVTTTTACTTGICSLQCYNRSAFSGTVNQGANVYVDSADPSYGAVLDTLPSEITSGAGYIYIGKVSSNGSAGVTGTTSLLQIDFIPRFLDQDLALFSEKCTVDTNGAISTPVSPAQIDTVGDTALVTREWVTNFSGATNEKYSVHLRNNNISYGWIKIAEYKNQSLNYGYKLDIEMTYVMGGDLPGKQYGSVRLWGDSDDLSIANFRHMHYGDLFELGQFRVYSNNGIMEIWAVLKEYVVATVNVNFSYFGSFTLPNNSVNDVVISTAPTGTFMYYTADPGTMPLSTGGVTSSQTVAQIDAVGDTALVTKGWAVPSIPKVITAVAPTIGTNGQFAITAVSNTQLRFSYRGTDGVTRNGLLTIS